MTPGPRAEHLDARDTNDLPAELTALKGVGPALAERLGRLNVGRPLDLLFLLPQRYEDRTRLTPLGSLQADQRAVVEGEVAVVEVVYRRRRSLLCRISDGTGQLTLRFFYFSRRQQDALTRGVRLRCYGQARAGPAGWEMIHPEYRLLREGETPPLEDRLTPVYPTTDGLQQQRLRRLIGDALDRWLGAVPDWLPPELLAELEMPSLTDALRHLHRPPAGADLQALATGGDPSQRRLALEEMLAHHLSLRSVRVQSQAEPAVKLPAAPEMREQFIGSLHFALTGGQQAALEDIDRDIAMTHPMMRLIQGDVGCGKTVVAAAAALTAIAHGHQVAMMAPTELLAEQHRDNFARWFAPLGINVVWLTGSLLKKPRELANQAIADGNAQLIVGTHALFQAGVNYRSLALVIVDEQHRFGVHQRLQLMDKGRREGEKRPHQLVLTATPIPRTLAMTMYADLDISVIRELPPGRQPVQTVALPEERRAEVIARVRRACKAGRRAYWVCPLIEESEIVPSQAAESTHAMLGTTLPELEVGLMHGRMHAAEKEQTMKAFAEGRIKVLVATTVIEVGVDVPEASLMIIENAERMGLSQLHQLRGRVGRGTSASTCVLLYRSPLSALAKKRLGVVRDTSDGFEIAQRDLELRGPGEVLGTRQTGLMQLRIADLLRDADLAPVVQRLAQRLLDDNPAAAAHLIHRWIGESRLYVNV